MREAAPVRELLTDLQAICSVSTTKQEAYDSVKVKHGEDVADLLKEMHFFAEKLSPVIKDRNKWRGWQPNA